MKINLAVQLQANAIGQLAVQSGGAIFKLEHTSTDVNDHYQLQAEFVF